jgi:hypothetical protein
MSEQKPRKPLGSYWRSGGNGHAQLVPPQHRARKPVGSYWGYPLPTLAPAPSIPYGSIILGLDIDTDQPVTVSQLDLCEGTYIEGKSGMGKTSLLEQIIYQQMQLDEAIIVIDPHGDLVNSIIAHMPERRLDKTYLLDLTDRKYPFGLNAFVCSDSLDEVKRDRTRNQIMHAFSKLWPEVLEQQYFKIYLPHVVITLIENPELTLANVERLLDDVQYRQRYTRHIKNARTHQFWQHYEKLNDNQKRIQTSSLRGRLDQLLTEPVIYNIMRQTKQTVNIRQLIEERAILLVKLPVNEEEYKYTAPVIGTFLMAMIYAATFSFADIPHLEDRPGFTLIVDEFQNFATDEYAKLFEQGRKYKVKQFLAHQHRQQLEREGMGKTNLAATLNAQTIIAFKTPNPPDARELASKFTSIGVKRQPTNVHIHPLEKIKYHAHPTVKQFVLDVVDQLDAASRLRIETVKERKSYEYPHEYFAARHKRREWRVGHYTETHKVYPKYNFGAGQVEIIPKVVAIVLEMLDKLIYHSEVQGKIDESGKETFIGAVAEYWKLKSDKPEEQAGARQRRTSFVKQLDDVLQILMQSPIRADNARVTNVDTAGLLENLERREAFVKTGSTAYAMATRDTRLLQEPTTAQEAAQRLRQVREQTRARYCVHRSELEEHEEEAAQREEIEEQPAQPEPDIPATYEPEPIEVPEPEIQPPEKPQQREPEQPPERIPAAGRDTMNMLYAQLRAKEIDPDTTILATLGEHYVLTIRQWMRLFAWKSYPKATQYFKTLRDYGLIYRKDREGRGGTLAQGDWFFLLTKGANELVRRKQPTPLFKLEPNEAEKASGDTLFHTYLVNEILIHLRLLEREHPDIVTIEHIDHERSMRRNYLQALGSETKLYPDGFLRLLVPTANGLKRRYTFLELEHTTQKDGANWKTKCRKYLALFDRPDVLAQFFSTRTPHVLVIAMDADAVPHIQHWTQEVLTEYKDKGRAYSSRFLIGAYDPGISDMTMPPEQFFCTPRFATPFQSTPHAVFGI